MMRNTISIIIAFGLFLFFQSSCEKWFWQPDKLHLEKCSYNGSELRIDGYYYDLYSKEKYMSVFFLYQNGIVRDGGGISCN